jgi:RHS repeat-associated protein
MQMPGRNASTGNYRYGFQGQETDDEVTGSESHVAWLYRCNDVRLGRFLSIDPLAPKYPELTPYQFSSNQPIHAPELEGLESSAPIKVGAPGFTDGETMNTYSGSQAAVTQSGGANYQTGNFDMTNRTTGQTVTQNTPDAIINDPQISVSSLYGGDDLQIVQIVDGSPVSISGIQQLTHAGVTRTAFVDGGINSPSGEQVLGKPYYNSAADQADANYGNMTYTSATGNITAFDVPGAVVYHTELLFETYIVITNYASTGKDQVVGRIDWGYQKDNNGNLVTVGTPTIINTSEFSERAAEIIKNDYPTYEVLGGGGL